MVKERTPQGATNSAHIEDSGVPPPKPRVPPPRLLTDEFEPTSRKSKSFGKKDKTVTATWKVDEVSKHDFKTVLGHTFNDKEHSLMSQAPKPKGYETQRREMRTFAVDKLRATAKERYGTVADMFAAVSDIVRSYSFYLIFWLFSVDV